MISWMYKVISSKNWDKHLLLWLWILFFFFLFLCRLSFCETHIFMINGKSFRRFGGNRFCWLREHEKRMILSSPELGIWLLEFWFYQAIEGMTMKWLHGVNTPTRKVKVSKIRWITPYQVIHSYCYWYRLSFKRGCWTHFWPFWKPPILICCDCLHSIQSTAIMANGQNPNKYYSFDMPR